MHPQRIPKSKRLGGTHRFAFQPINLYSGLKLKTIIKVGLYFLLSRKFRQNKFLPLSRLGGDGQSISSMSSSSSTSSTSTGNNHNQRHNDFLLAQELERRERERLKHEEQREFDQLRAQFGMDNDGNFHTQSISNMQNAVYRGEMSVVDYYERQVGYLCSNVTYQYRVTQIS